MSLISTPDALQWLGEDIQADIDATPAHPTPEEAGHREGLAHALLIVEKWKARAAVASAGFKPRANVQINDRKGGNQ